MGLLGMLAALHVHASTKGKSNISSYGGLMSLRMSLLLRAAMADASLESALGAGERKRGAGWWWSEVRQLCCSGGVPMVAKSLTLGSVVQRCSVWRVGDHAVSVVECVLHIGCRD